MGRAMLPKPGVRADVIITQLGDLLAQETYPTGVLDSNSLLHHAPPNQMRWDGVIGSPVRLVVPLRVVQELDDKKASNSKPLRQRAAKRLRQLGGRD